MTNSIKYKIAFIGAMLIGSLSYASTLTVGPGKTYPTPCAAFAQAVDGDTIEIDGSGNYTGNVCQFGQNNLTIRGVNGRPRIEANGQYAWGKGTWVVSGNNNVIENIELSGASVPDRNGAGIRMDGTNQNLTVRKMYFHDNENGILTNNLGGNLTVENSEFSHNGAGDGYSHNLYVGHIDSLTFVGNYSHDANVGHNLKSRAQVNTVKYNRFSSTGAGAPSYEVNFPNGGTTYLIGNIIQQPPQYNNSAIVTYGEEGNTNTGQDFYVINNTIINDASYGTFFFIGGGVQTPAIIQNNILVGTGTFSTQGSTIDSNNYKTLSPQFVDRANYDLKPLSTWNSVVDMGVVSTPANGLSLIPTQQYVLGGTVARPIDSKIDIGAIEGGSAVPVPSPTTPPPTTPEFTLCAVEGGICNFSGTMQVKYGANGNFTYKIATNSIGCNNSVFGDPIVGTAKTCMFAPTATTSPFPAPAPVTWTNCASENSVCSFIGTNQVRYGANNVYVYRVVTNSIACNNATFSDPIVGVFKTCDYSSGTTTPTPAPTPAPVSSWVECGQENSVCSFDGTHQVRYGYNGTYAYQTATGSINCNNATFGDPVYGTVKSCEVYK
jgi:hypothetical protein